jgi:hypothetical protein
VGSNPDEAVGFFRAKKKILTWKHLNFRVTTPAFSAYGAWQCGSGGESWNVQYGASTISHKAEVLPEA